MESVKLALMKRIREAMSEIATVDEDYGQLETEGDHYPVFFPCVLIAHGQTEWQTVTNRSGLQQGKTPVTLKLALDCYDDTHDGSTTEEKIAERERMAERMFRSVQGMRPTREVSELDRRRSTEYTLGSGIKVYEVTFEYLVRAVL